MKLPKKVYESEAEGRRDFWIGLGGWFGINVPLAVLVFFTGLTGRMVIGVLALVLNVGGLILLALIRHRMAGGALVALTAGIFLSFCLGSLFLVYWCFSQPW